MKLEIFKGNASANMLPWNTALLDRPKAGVLAPSGRFTESCKNQI